MKFWAVALLNICVLTAGAQTVLRYQMKAGSKVEYRCSNKVDLSTTQMGSGEQSSSFATKAVVDINPEITDGESLVFTSTFKACSTVVKMPGQGIKDSTIALTPILGKRTRETMTPFGKVTSTTIVDTPNIDDQLLLLLSQNASDLSNIWMEFGGNPVKPSDTWKIQQKDTNDAPGNGKVYTTTNFQYHYLHNADTLNHTCAVIKYTTDVTVEGGFTNPISHTDLTVDGDGKGNGTIYFDLAKGMIVANNSKIEANQSLSVQGQTDPVLTSSKSVTAHLVIAE